MKERVLFHLRLGDSSLGLENSAKSTTAPSEGLAESTRTGKYNEAKQRGNHCESLICTCIHSSSSSSVVIGFEAGVVHLYDRLPDDGVGGSPSCEEEKWQRFVLYPTKALNAVDPISSPPAAPDITCIQRGPGGTLAVGTSNGFVFVTQAPPPAKGGSNGRLRTRGAGFHHKSHRGRRINCLLWDPSGDQLFSVCEGGIVVLARNLRPRQGGASASPPGMTGVMSFLGIHDSPPRGKLQGRESPAAPQAIIVGHAGSPGIQLDLGRARAAVSGVKRDCDVLLVMTRERAVLLYFAVGEDISMVAPYETTVDLNIIHQAAGETLQPNGAVVGTPPPSVLPPSTSDLGGCLWGPPQGPLMESSRVPQANSAPGGDNPSCMGNLPDPQIEAPRPVVFAYVGQPGGKLWRVGLFDGEVESTHSPPALINGDGVGLEGRGVGGALGGGRVELGQLRAVDVGGSQKILCWRSGPGAHAGGDVALLDPLSHRFVAAYPGLSGVVDLSGCLLAPWGALETEGPSMPTVQQRLERLRGPVRLLHGGDAAKVIQLDAEGAAWTVSSSTAASARCTPTARDVAASKVQRAWKARRDRRNKRLAAWKNSVLQPYVPATPNGGAMSPTVRDIATGETAGAEFSSSPSTVRKSRGRSAVLRDEHADGEGFSILDSLDALDAADRVLQLSAQSGDSSVASGARREAKAEMWQDRSRQGTSASESGASSGSGSEGGKALLRATDALIRQTLPVLRRTRSLQAFALSPRAHPEDGTPASTPAALDDARGQGAHITAAIEAEAKRAAAAAEEFFGPSRDTEAAEVVGTLEDGERKWEDALTSHASSPSRSPSPGQREEVSTKRCDRSSPGSESDGSGSRPSAPLDLPFPSGDRTGLSSPFRGSDFPKSPDKRRRRSTPRVQHGSLLGPMQNIMGSLLQRSVQAVNNALQPGGGATSDDSPYEEDDNDSFARQDSRESGGDSRFNGSGHGNDLGADGGTTSDTGKESWGASSDRSEMDSHSNSTTPGTGQSRGAGSDGRLLGAMGSAGDRIEGESTPDRRKGKRGKMLLVSGMMGVKRQSLGTLRSRRDLRLRPSMVAVVDLPLSTMDDPSPFVPPSQYEVRLNVSRGLGLSLQITGNDVRVKGFSPIQGGDDGPAQACGQIQVGDALVRVNHEQLTLLNHSRVVHVLRGLLNLHGSQILLLRFAYAEDSPRRQAVATTDQPPSVTRHSSLATPSSEKRPSPTSAKIDDADDAFRPESWHGSRRARGAAQGDGGDGREIARSVSPPHFAGREAGSVGERTRGGDDLVASRRSSRSIGNTADIALGLVSELEKLERSGMETGGRSEKRRRTEEEGAVLALGPSIGGKEARTEGWTAPSGSNGELKQGKGRPGELWGEQATGFEGADGGSRHVYLGDMGHARAQRTLGSIAQDVQGLYRLKSSSEEARFFHGDTRRGLADPSQTCLDERNPPPSAVLATSSGATGGRPSSASTLLAPEYLPALPTGQHRGRRRRRPRRRRSLPAFTSGAAEGEGAPGDREEGGGVGGDWGGSGARGVIDLSCCREVVQCELRRLEGDLERQRARLARRKRQSSVRGLVAKMLQHSGRSSASLEPATSPPDLGRLGLLGLPDSENGSRIVEVVGGGRACDGRGEFSDGFLDSDDSVSETTGTALARFNGFARGNGPGDEGESYGGPSGGDDLRATDVGVKEPACDIFLEAVSTAGMQEELLNTPAAEVLGVDPPRPLPPAAYDLQTALESVQHFATQTLAGVVHAEATRGFHSEASASSRSPRLGGSRITAAVKEAKEGAVAAGVKEGWESAWPPRELTAALGLVTARQMAHAMRCDAEPLIQVWMRCFTPVDIKHRGKLWGALAPSPMDTHEAYAGRWHRQLVCGLVTLFAQVHMSWPFLARPSDDPNAVGLLSLRLEITWFSAQEDGDGPGPAAADDRPEEEAASPSGGAGEGGGRGPEQWDEEKAVGFIQGYGSYLEADAVAAAASCREMEWALHEALGLAEQCGNYRTRERVLHQLLRGPRTPLARSPVLGPAPCSPASGALTPTTRITSPGSPSLHAHPVPVAASAGADAAAPTLDANPMEEEAVRKALGLPGCRGDAREEEAVGGGAEKGGSVADPPLGSSPLCLLLNNLGELFRWDTAAAAGICADAFPGVRPWNVHVALHQDTPWSAAEPMTPAVGGGRHPAGDDTGLRNDAAFHCYLWAMMEKHPRECRRDWKMVQRCLQLSLRLSTKLRSLPPDQPLHAFCKAATRNNSCRRHTSPDADVDVNGRAEAFPVERGGAVFSPGDNRGWRTTERGAVTPVCRSVAGEWDGGKSDYVARRRYTDIVQEVVSAWCRDPGSFALDPLWLLPKLRVHRNWPIAFQVCAAITRSWEEQNALGDMSSASRGVGTYSTGLASTLAVFDTLADACFASFEAANTTSLASALGAIWAADGAIRRVRVSTDGGGGWEGGGTGSQDVEDVTGETSDAACRDFVSGVGDARRRGDDEDEKRVNSTVRGANGDGEPSADSSDSWVVDSRMMDVVASLAQRCREAHRAERTRDGGDRGDVGGASPTVSDAGSGEWPSALSLVDLAHAVLDGVGPEAAGDVLEACPLLLENMPAKFFQDLADRQAALYQQTALEATLLRQVTAAVWAARGHGVGGTRIKGIDRSCSANDPAGDGANPLGPRLAWLACEELTSFFQNPDTAASLGQARPIAAPAQTVQPRTASGLFSDKRRIEGEHGEAAKRQQQRQRQRFRHQEELVKRAIERTGLNLVLPRSTDRGASFCPASACGFCGLALAGVGCPAPASSGGTLGGATAGGGDKGVEVVVRGCGHGFHVRCVEQGRGRGTGLDGLGLTCLPCPQCTGGGGRVAGCRS